MYKVCIATICATPLLSESAQAQNPAPTIAPNENRATAPADVPTAVNAHVAQNVPSPLGKTVTSKLPDEFAVDPMIFYP